MSWHVRGISVSRIMIPRSYSDSHKYWLPNLEHLAHLKLDRFPVLVWLSDIFIYYRNENNNYMLFDVRPCFGILGHSKLIKSRKWGRIVGFLWWRGSVASLCWCCPARLRREQDAWSRAGGGAGSSLSGQTWRNNVAPSRPDEEIWEITNITHFIKDDWCSGVSSLADTDILTLPGIWR